MNTQLTLDHDLMKDPQFHKIKEILQKLKASGIMANMAGNCISTADIVQHVLTQVGIPSKIVECQACLIRNGTQVANDILFIGYDNSGYQGQIDTHVVVITQTENPLLIDLSLGHVLPADHPYIVERLNGDTVSKIAEYNIGNINLTYTVKKNIRLVNLHQKSLIDRITSEQETEKKITWFQKIIYFVAGLTAVNFVLNSIILTLKYINP